MANIPPKSSKWVDINRDLMAAQTVEPQVPSTGIETPTLALDDDLVPKTKTTLKRNGTTAVRRRPYISTTATKTRP